MGLAVGSKVPDFGLVAPEPNPAAAKKPPDLS